MKQRKKVSLNSLRQLRQFKAFIKPEELEKDLINTLAAYGQKIINMAYRTSTYKDRTFSLRDSYVSAVFKNGKLIPGTERFVTYTKADGDYAKESNISREYNDLANGDPEMTTGREEAKLFLSNFQGVKWQKNSITLVVAATMFYAGILEDPRWGYLVISHVTDEMEEIKRLGIKLNETNATIDKFYISNPRVIREGGKGRMQIDTKANG